MKTIVTLLVAVCTAVVLTGCEGSGSASGSVAGAGAASGSASGSVSR